MASARDVYCGFVLNALRALGPSQPKAVYDWIRCNETPPASDVAGLTSDGKNLFEKNVRWARFTLSKQGAVIAPKRGIWALAPTPPSLGP